MRYGEKSMLKEFGIDHTVIRVEDTDKMKALRLEIENQNATYLARFEAQEATHQAAVAHLQGQYNALKESLQKKEFKSYLAISYTKRLMRNSAGDRAAINKIYSNYGLPT